MSDNLSFQQQYRSSQNPASIPPPPAKKKSKLPWLLGGCAVLAILAVVFVAIVAGIIFLPGLLGGDPIAAHVPNEAIIYGNVDLLKTQSDDLTRFTKVFQEIAGTDQTDLKKTLDDAMEQDYGMSFTDDVMPWLGRYASFAVTGADLNYGDYHYFVVIQTLNSAKAKKFLKDFTQAMEYHNGTSFDQSEREGVLFYTHKGEASWETNTVFALAGKFVYIAESEQDVLDSYHLKKSDSIAGTNGYKSAIGALPKNRLATVYLNGKKYSDILDSLLQGAYLSSSSIYDLGQQGFSGMAVSLSTQNEGVRMDFAATYDQAKVSDFQRESLGARYSDPHTDEMVPEDTFIYLGSNSSLKPGRVLADGSPLNTQDVQDALDMFDQEYNINIHDLLNLLGGEYGLAVAPSNNSFLSQNANTNVGVMFLASTNDENAANAWIGNVKNYFTDQMNYENVSEDDISFGRYNLKGLTGSDGYQTYPLMFYGADNGYIVLGMGEDMLREGLNSGNTLANNPDYRNTWKAFPAGSVPFLYVDTRGIMKMISSQGDSIDRSTRLAFNRIPTIAMTVNNAKGYTQSMTIIVFIDTGE